MVSPSRSARRRTGRREGYRFAYQPSDSVRTPIIAMNGARMSSTSEEPIRLPTTNMAASMSGDAARPMSHRFRRTSTASIVSSIVPSPSALTLLGTSPSVPHSPAVVASALPEPNHGR